MSVEYSVKFGIFKKINLEEMISVWEKSLSNKVYYNCSDDSSSYIFFVKGSIRGFSVNRTEKNKNELTIRSNYYSSQEDAELVCSFIKFLNKGYNAKIFNEDGSLIKSIDIDEIQSRIMDYNSLQFFERIFESENYMNLPLWDIDIVIYKSDFDRMKQSCDFPDNFNKYLKDKAYKIFLSRRAAQIKIDSGTIISVWAFDDMVVYPVDIIAMTNPLIAEEHVFVKWDDFINSEFVTYETIPLGKEQGNYYFVNKIGENLFSTVFEAFRGIEVSAESL